MERRIRAVLLSGLIWPGTGQIVNGQRLKGFALGALSLLLGLGIAGLVATAVLASMPDDLETLDVALVRAQVHETLARPGGPLTLLIGLLVVVWVYAIVD